MSDEDPSYASFKQLFADHRTINHSKEFSKPDGTNNNQAESFVWRVRRAIEGVYLSASNKYLKDYACGAGLARGRAPAVYGEKGRALVSASY